MLRLRRTIPLVLAAGLALFALAGCGGDKSTNPPTLPALSQQEADDLMQQAAVMMATDIGPGATQGGWLVDVYATLMTLPYSPTFTPSMSRRVLAMPASAGRTFQALYDTTFSIGGMNYQMTFFYTDTLGESLGVWEGGVEDLEGVSIATGTLTASGFSGFLRHLGEPITAYGIQADSDTINFSGVGDDSLFATFRSVFRGDTVHYDNVSFTDYDLYIIRDGSSPYPTDGYATSYLFVDRLRTPNVGDIAASFDGQVTVLFDGTLTPIAEVTNDPDGAPQYRYRVNLRTGALTRL